MKPLRSIIFLMLLLSAAIGFFESGSTTHANETLDTILDRIEKRYALPGFSARFYQISTIKDMQIKDTASGSILVKRPGRMKWEYETPERQIIITDGKKLWIYRPEDRQVMVGEAPTFFGDGKGAGFLTDIKHIRRQFSVSLEKADAENIYILKLIPEKKTLDISRIFLSISKQTFDVVEIVTFNAYGDETRIALDNFTFLQNPDDAIFHFDIPAGVDIIELQK